MKTFITGATGYIGFNVAKAMRRAGHEVWGLTRSEEKTAMLSRNEIHSVVGNMQQPESYRKVAGQCSVLIHAAADYANDTAALDLKTIDAFIGAGKTGARPKMVIYTSGCWVLGDTGDAMIDETTPLNPIEAVSWRPKHEQRILEAEHLHSIILRPGCVYGKGGGLTSSWFQGAVDGQMKIVGDGSNYWTMVHVDDLSDAYVRTAESGLKNEIFNISDRSRWTVGEMAESVKKAAGYNGDISYVSVEEAAQEMGPTAEALALSQHVDSSKAVRRLGWQPNHGGFVDQANVFFEAWKAHNGQ